MFCYTGLWVILAKKGMNKTDLRLAAKMGPATLAKIGKDQPVSMEVLAKICDCLGCDIGDIVRYMPEEGEV